MGEGDVEDVDARVELARLKKEFADFLEFLPDALFEIDLASVRITRLNRMATILTGWTMEHVERGLEVVEIVTAQDFERMVELTHSLINPCETAGKPYQRTGRQDLVEVTMIRADGSRFIAELQGSFVLDGRGRPYALRGTARDITSRRESEHARQRMIGDLQAALLEVRTLSGLLPICAWCRRIRDDQGYWKQLEDFIRQNSDADFTHGVCPECADKITAGRS